MQSDLNPKVIVPVIAVVLIVIGLVMYKFLSTPADFSGPKVEIKPPKGFAVPGRPGVGVAPHVPAPGSSAGNSSAGT